MELVLTYQRTVKDLKRQFNKAFPYLKLEFFSEANVTAGGSPATKMVPGSRLLGEITGILREGELTIRPEDTVAEVESAFQSRFGLPVQVFRKQQNTWLQTTTTDHRTLAEQNAIGLEASRPATRTLAESSLD